jgi:hypothetical protein
MSLPATPSPSLGFLCIAETSQALSPLFDSLLNYVGEFRQRIWPLFLCASVVELEHSGSPQRQKDTENLRSKFSHTK